MPRNPRELKPEYSYHITTRCNNREFRLTRTECRELLLYAIEKARQKFQFKLYGLCIMSNHVHYLLEPARPEDLPKIMHWLNWYTAMCFNRMLNRTGHFWEKRYHSTGFPNTDRRRALNTLRYIHANPFALACSTAFFTISATMASMTGWATMALLNGIQLFCPWARLWMNALLSIVVFVRSIAPNLNSKRKIIGEVGYWQV